jgi:hypothetical protein
VVRGRWEDAFWIKIFRFYFVLMLCFLTSPAGCGRSVGIVRLRTKTTEFSLVFFLSFFGFGIQNGMCLIKYHAMKTVYGSGGTTTHIVYLGSRWVVSDQHHTPVALTWEEVRRIG